MAQALEILLDVSGIRFDAGQARACVALFEQEGYRFP
jgi:hypothetical protein